MKTGVANLPLHHGQAPGWLFGRMTKLGREITIYIVKNFGTQHFLTRLSHPGWFQSLGCLLGFDWHSSGLTTTTCAALKVGLQGLEDELGLYICGGKGATSRKTPGEIEAKSSEHSSALVRSSRLSAKVDSAALQDGYQLYHHSFFFDKDGNWAVVQQGMNDNNHYARRYHWLSDGLESFTCNPHQAICCDEKTEPLNLVAEKSRDCQDSIVNITADAPAKILHEWDRITRLDLPARHYIKTTVDLQPRFLKKVLLTNYQEPKDNFGDLLLTRGLGPKTLRALTLLAEVLAGSQPSFTDPVRYSFAHGGKDGIPYPVNKSVYDNSIAVLKEAVREAKVSPYEKDRAHQRLLDFVQTG